MNAQVKQDGRLKTFLIYGAPIVLYGSCILAISSIPDLSGPDLKVVPFDKIAHVLEYAGFAVLICRGLWKIGRKRSPIQVFALTAVAVAIFALLDELYQSTVPGRFSDSLDWTADTLGGAIGTALVLFLHRKS